MNREETGGSDEERRTGDTSEERRAGVAGEEDRAGVTDREQETLEPFNAALLDLLVCPVTRQPLTLDAERSRLVSAAARLAYPIRDGIPILLPQEAQALDPDTT